VILSQWRAGDCKEMGLRWWLGQPTWSWMFVLLVVLGCNQGGLQKVIVVGDVSYNGEPVKNGEILFYPTGDTQGPVSGASIKDGHYEAIGKGGVPVGTHRAVIRGFRAAKPLGKAATNVANQLEQEGGIREQCLPAKYNDQSTLEVTVEGNQRRVVKDFSLTN